MTSKVKALGAKEQQLAQAGKKGAAREVQLSKREASLSHKELDVSEKERRLFEKQQAVSRREAGVSEAESRVSSEARRISGLSEELKRSKREADERENRCAAYHAGVWQRQEHQCDLVNLISTSIYFGIVRVRGV